MSGRGSRVDSRIAAVVDFMIRCPGAKVPEAMLAKNFTLAESSNLAKRQAIRRAYKEAMKKRDAASSSREIVLSSPSKTLSPLTSDTATAAVTAGGDSTSSQPPSTPTTPGSRRSSPRLKQRPKLHVTRKNARAMQKHRVNKLATSDFVKRAFKRATSWYSREVKKPNGKSSYEIAILVKKEYDGIGPHAATIRRYVNANLSGMSPLKPGVKGDVPAWAFKSLCVAFESYIRICQINSKIGEITYKKLATRINTVLKHDYRQKMLQRALSATANNLDVSMMSVAEDRRVRWTTFTNISSWFDNWEWDLVELGFAKRDEDGMVRVPDELLIFILNFDETCLSLDGSNGNKGGRKTMTLHDPRLPFNGKQTNKDSLTATLVCGSNATGEALPPHFQFQTKATTDDGQRIRNEVFQFCPRVVGKFGTKAETSWDCTFGLNTKGGMDDREFVQYVTNSILPLYPETRDRKGHRLLLKCDSGPGRLQVELLAQLRHLGVYLYPGVPNTTAVTQETDRTYGVFKSKYRANLEDLVDELVRSNKPVSVPQYKHGLLVFGGVDPDTGLHLPSAFEEGFSRVNCLNSWKKIGAAPLTRACLKDPQVTKSMDSDKDFALLVNSVQEANDYAVYALTEGGFDGSALQGLMEIKPADNRMGPITERMSRERIELLARANTHGKKFFATGGSHVCSDDFFKAQALQARDDEIEQMIKLKKLLLGKTELRNKAMGILVAKSSFFESNNYREVSTKELDVLLSWYGVDIKGMKKPEKVEKWKEIRGSNTEPPTIEGWTEKDEEKLRALTNKDIDMSETFLGRFAALQKRNAVAAVLDMSDDERESLKALRDADAGNSTEKMTDNNHNIQDEFEGENDLLGVDINAERV